MGLPNTDYFVDSHTYSSYKGAYKNLKIDSPAFIPSGVVDSTRKVITSSSILCLEFDDIKDNKTTELSKLCGDINQTLASFTTLSGNGLAILVLLDKPQETEEEHQAAWFAASIYYNDLGTLIAQPNLKLDILASRFNQPRGIVYDPDVFVNINAIPINWSKDFNANLFGFNEKAATITQSNLGVGNKVIHQKATSFYNLDITYQLFFKDYLFKYSSEETINQWQSYKIPCPWNNHEHDDSELDIDKIGFSSTSNATAFMPIENGYKLRCFKSNMMGDFIYEYKNTLILHAERKLKEIGYTYTKEQYKGHTLLIVKCPIQEHDEQAVLIGKKNHIAFYCERCNVKNLLFDRFVKHI